MRKKILWGFAFIGVLATAFLLWAPVNFGIKKEIEIASPIYNVAAEITILRNWKNWNPELRRPDTASFIYSPGTSQVHSFLQAGDHLYTILEGNPAYSLIKEQTKGNIEYHSLYASSDSLGTSTWVVWIRALSPLSWLKAKIFPDGEMEAGLNQLKKFMEDPNLYYGFHISIGHVDDTLVLTKSTIAAKSEKFTALLRLYREIRQYGLVNHININQSPIASFTSTGPDSIQISAGIPITQKGPAEKGFDFLSIPKAGWMLKGNYEGPYSGIKALYVAMEKYITDKRKQRVALPFEKYLTGPPSGRPEDSLNMKIMVYFPVY